MPKKRKSNRSSRASRKQSSGRQGNENISSTELLRRFKRFWALEEWNQALSAYREWTNKTGRKRDTRIEGELLYRVASRYFADGDCERSVDALAKADKLDPDNHNRYLYSMGITFARRGNTPSALKIFREIGEEYHSTVLSQLHDLNGCLPDDVSGKPILDRSVLLDFWKGLEEFTLVSNPALENLSAAFRSVKTAEGDPERPVKLLAKKKDLGVCT